MNETADVLVADEEDQLEDVPPQADLFAEHYPGRHDQKTHGNKWGKADDGSHKLLYQGGSGGRNQKLEGLIDKYSKEADHHHQQYEQLTQTRFTSKSAAKQQARSDAIQLHDGLRRDMRGVSLLLSRAYQGGAEARKQLLPKLQDTLARAQSVQDTSQMHPARIERLKQVIADVQDALGTKESDDGVGDEMIDVEETEERDFSQKKRQSKESDEPTLTATESIDTATPFSPKERVARLKVYWLEDNAVSLNGRQYPQSAVDTLIASAHRQLADTNALPLTCYISHGAAEQDDSMKIAGRVTEVGREGTKAYAWVDLSDTNAGRTLATLASGGYIKSMSLRADGAQLTTSRTAAYPQVGGSKLTLRGIDFTTTPGLDQIARIGSVLFEDTEMVQPVQEVFAIDRPTFPTEILDKKEASPPMSNPIREDAIPPQVSGVTVGVNGSDPQDDYAKRQMPVPTDAFSPVLPAGGTHPSIKEAHDHVAEAAQLPCAPQGKALEHGKIMAAAQHAKLLAAHEALAKAGKMDCEGKYTSAPVPSVHTSPPTDNDGDYDDDSKMEATKKPMESHLTPEAAVQLLEAAGYTIQRPKTKAEVLQEQIEAQQVQLAQLTEMMTKLTTTAIAAPATPAPVQTPTPQRKSMIESADSTITESPYVQQKRQRRNSYVKERLDGMSEQEWRVLADKAHPLPDDFAKQPERLLKEMEHYLLAMYEQKYGLAALGAN